MSAEDQARPRSYSWIARVYTENDHGNDELAGCGVVIDDRRVLTCAHVVGRFDGATGWAGDADVRVGFPKNDEGGPGQLLPVRDIVFPDSGKPEDDLAVLYLAGPLPAGVEAAPLRRPDPACLAAGQWRVLGFPDDLVGESASGTVEELARGWIRLNKESGDRLRRGFSGSGVWSAEYQAVVAVVAQAGGGDGRALTLHQASALLPRENLDDLARWSLAYDREAEGHWEPRARGVSIGSYPRPRFRGRKAALLAIKRWLDQDQASRRVLVVTGAPGAGKSAVLSRIVTTASPGRKGQLPAPDDGIRAAAGSVRCAVHAKGKTALEVATEIARAASAKLPDRLENFDRALHRALTERSISDDGSDLQRRFNVIIDALDEAASPEQARIIISKVILPLAEKCADAGVQVIVGSRRADAEGDLLGAFGRAAELVNLDDEEFFAQEDLADYAQATLQMGDREQAGSPYADDAVARPVADRIAELSDRNFLIAGLTAQAHGLFDTTPVVPAALSFSPEVKSVMDEYLRRVPGIAGMPGPVEVLRALAFAEAPGFPVSLWRGAIRALYGQDVPEMRLEDFAKSQAASFLVESSEEDGQGSVFRLFHQALDEALLAAVGRGTARRAEQALARAFLTAGQDAGWEHASAYVRRHLAGHAARGGVLDEVLTNPEYLVHAIPAGLTPYLHTATAARSRLAAAVYAASAGIHRSVTADRRRQILALDAARYNDPALLTALNSRIGPNDWKPLHATGGKLSPALRSTLVGHTEQVTAVTCTMLDGRPVAVSGSRDCTVRVWDLTTGQPIGQPFTGHTDEVEAVACTVLDGRPVAVTGSKDCTVRVWDLTTGAPAGGPYDLANAVDAVACTYLDGRAVVIVSTRAGETRILDVADGRAAGKPFAYTACARTLACTRLDGEPVVVIACQDCTAQVWDLTTGNRVGRPIKLDNAADSVACTMLDDRPVAVTSAGGRHVTAWDLATGRAIGKPFAEAGGQPFEWVCQVACTTLDDRAVVVTGSSRGSVRTWDLATGQPLGPDLRKPGRVTTFSLACTVIDGRPVAVVSVADDNVVQVLDLCMGRDAGQSLASHADVVRAVACTVVNSRPVAVTASGSTSGPAFGSDYNHVVRVWDLATGQPFGQPFGGHTENISAISCTVLDGRPVVVTGSDDRSVRVWDLITGRPVGRPFTASCCEVSVVLDRVDAVACTLLEGSPVAVVAGSQFDTTIWDLRSGRCIRKLWDSRACAIACTEMNGRPIAITGSHRVGIVCIWDLISGEPIGEPLDGHGASVRAVACTVLDGKPVAVTGSDDRTVRLWDLTAGQPVGQPLIGHTDSVISVACAVLNGRPVAITSAHDSHIGMSDGPDHTIRVWDLVTFTSAVINLPAACSCVATAAPDYLVCAFDKDIAVFTRNPQAVPGSA